MWLIGVVKLAEQNEKKTRHLRSARQWLTQAEESFDEDREVRGELNLFLAQAELQRAKETGLNRGWLKKYSALRHGLAVVVAVTVASVAYGVYNQVKRRHSPTTTRSADACFSGDAFCHSGESRYSPADTCRLASHCTQAADG